MAELQSPPLMVSVGAVGTACGSAMVRVGGTSVICGIKAELARPSVSLPDEGYLVANVHLSALSSSTFRSGPPSDEAQALSQWVHDVWQKSAMVDTKELCLAAGKLCWVLYADITCVNYDGSLSQACLASLVAALKSLTLPEVDLSEGEFNSSPLHSKVRTSLSLQCIPSAVSFTFSRDKKTVCCPSGEEERTAAGILTVVTCDEQNICDVTKSGGIPLSSTTMRDCYLKAFSHSINIRKVILEATNNT